jgi:sulfotransferase
MRDIFYVSGLPRSGSTLLMNLMAQNPKVFCTPTSGLNQLMNNIKTSWGHIIDLIKTLVMMKI